MTKKSAFEILLPTDLCFIAILRYIVTKKGLQASVWLENAQKNNKSQKIFKNSKTLRKMLKK